jgi:hypothetical protein
MWVAASSRSRCRTRFRSRTSFMVSPAIGVGAVDLPWIPRPSFGGSHRPLNLPRPYMGVPLWPGVALSRGRQMQARSRARSMLARQNRPEVVSCEDRSCPQASHADAASLSWVSADPGDWISVLGTVMSHWPDFASPAGGIRDLLAGAHRRGTLTPAVPTYAVRAPGQASNRCFLRENRGDVLATWSMLSPDPPTNCAWLGGVEDAGAA